ncbi:MAG: hypothetical protein KTR31_20865, partial [Myxococcales bacterium]|nr:hypothetical protein [Myxococcales bacterium]
MRWWAVMLASLALPSLANAACERQIRSLQRASGDAVAKAYAAIAACSKEHGASQFAPALKRAPGAEGIAAVAVQAIRHDVVAPVHGMLEGIGDYSTRERVTEHVGAACSDPAVLGFVRDLHDALKDRAFVSWSGAVQACPAPEVSADLEGWAAEPPALKFDNKYAKVAELYGRRTGVEGLPLLA